jgi:hypothetical protein
MFEKDRIEGAALGIDPLEELIYFDFFFEVCAAEVSAQMWDNPCQRLSRSVAR